MVASDDLSFTFSGPKMGKDSPSIASRYGFNPDIRICSNDNNGHECGGCESAARMT